MDFRVFHLILISRTAVVGCFNACSAGGACGADGAGDACSADDADDADDACDASDSRNACDVRGACDVYDVFALVMLAMHMMPLMQCL